VVAAFQALPLPDYVSGPEEPEQAPPLPEFVPEPVYPEFMSLEDDEDDDEDPEEDPADYPTDRDNDEEEEPFGVEADDEDKDEDDKEEEEEKHLTPTDFVPPPPVHRTTTRISIPTQAPVPFLSEEEVERFFAIPTPPPSPLTPLSSPLPHIPSPPLPRAESPSTSHSLPLPPPIILSHTKAPMAIMMAVAPSTYTLSPPLGSPLLLPIPLPTPSPPLLLPYIDHRADMPEDEILVGMSGAPATDDTELGRRMTEFATMRERLELSRVAWDVMATSDFRELYLCDLYSIVIALQGQQGPIGGPAQPEVSEEAGSSS
ncbi:hypothetical protein Tco_0469688, partial [Tanacetum coccineum]